MTWRTIMLAGLVLAGLAILVVLREGAAETYPEYERDHRVTSFEITSPEQRITLIEDGWLPPGLDPDIEILSAQRQGLMESSNISIRVTPEQLAALRSKIPPVDWSRFPRGPSDFDFGQTSLYRDDTLNRADVEPESPLLHGELCENGIYWRYMIVPEMTGMVTSSTYQPGACSEEEISP